MNKNLKFTICVDSIVFIWFMNGWISYALLGFLGVIVSFTFLVIGIIFQFIFNRDFLKGGNE